MVTPSSREPFPKGGEGARRDRDEPEGGTLNHPNKPLPGEWSIIYRNIMLC